MKKWLKIVVALAVLVGVVAVGVMLTPIEETETEETGCYHEELEPSIVDGEYHSYYCTVCGNTYKEKHDFSETFEDKYGIHIFCKCGLEKDE